DHAAAGDEKPAALTNGSATAKFTPKPRVGGAVEEENGFDVNQDFSLVKDFDGLALAARCLVRLCENGNLTVAAELIQAKADVNMPEPDIGVTPLIAAANAGHLDICKYLFRKGAEVSTEVQDGTRRTALHAAAQMGFASVVQLLLEKNADPRVEDLTKTHPLHLAVRFGHAGAAELLLKGKANPNCSDDQGHVAINDAVAKDRFDLVTKLLEHGALVNVRNMAGLEAISFSRTPQMQSIIMKHDVAARAEFARQPEAQRSREMTHLKTARHHEVQDRPTDFVDRHALHNMSQTLPAKDAVGNQSPTLSAKDAGNASAVTSTAALDNESLSTRRNLYGAIIFGSCGSLVFGFICALKYAQAKKSVPKAGAANKIAEDGSGQRSFAGGGAGYEYQQLEEAAQEVHEGLGQEEIEDMLEQLSPEEREARLNAWALARAEKLRSDNAGFYVLRKTVLVALMILYVAGSTGIPALHRGEASCSQGFFWETHMQFLAIVLVTKLAELALMASDDMVAWDKVHLVDMLIKFLPSFLGFLDGYTDANAIVIAAACDHPLAQAQPTAQNTPNKWSLPVPSGAD
ncbi:warA, partial [Symbiodinium necroappetens]